jgi:hypothetical protein
MNSYLSSALLFFPIPHAHKHRLTLYRNTYSLVLPGPFMDQPSSREIISRAKRYLPSIAATKGVVMPIAALDPNKIAPICCASLFSIIELSIIYFSLSYTIN